MTKNFNFILEKNKEVITFISEIIKKIDEKEEESFLNFFKDCLILIILKKEHEEVGALKKIKSEFLNKKYNKTFKEVKCKYVDSVVNIDLLDNNNRVWSFLINNIGEVSLNALKCNDLNNNVSLVYNKSKTIIVKSTNEEEVIFDLTKKELDRNEADIIFLTKDINVSSFVNYEIDNCILKIKERSLKKTLI